MTIRQTTIWGLEELADRDEQTRLWLSDGSSGEVSSFDEAVDQVFERDIERAIERNEFPEPLLRLFKRLSDLTRKVPNGIARQDLISHPIMDDVRETAQEILKILKRESNLEA